MKRPAIGSLSIVMASDVNKSAFKGNEGEMTVGL